MPLEGLKAANPLINQWRAVGQRVRPPATAWRLDVKVPL